MPGFYSIWGLKMRSIMFDVDGTLLQSYDCDAELFVEAVEDELQITMDQRWENYRHVSDSGILLEICENAGLASSSKEIEQGVKRRFLKKLDSYLATEVIEEVPGAKNFLDFLLAQKDVSLSIATGGWKESAILKLDSAGLYFEQIPLASANDHYDRTEIMTIAHRQIDDQSDDSNWYFGDAIWDQKACKDLDYNFIAIGDRVQHKHRFQDFQKKDEILELIQNA